ncbi:uncharacterized protein LOC129227457 [Uloborus diversus]|uniref:uncharacterized protein LOC129227457 n=1 Tax=Uloborus diversus TaxID=327109 RepID=UPI00240A82AC|nr:uncharacterized protein LOC129227457 [Uloborus diversus]
MTLTTWKKVETKFCQVLKQNLEKKLMDPVCRQILFEVLGNDFVNKYHSSYTNNPAILNNVRAEKKQHKMAEMKLLITSIIDNILQKKGVRGTKLLSDVDSFSQELENLIDEDLEELSTTKKSKKYQKREMSETYLNKIVSSDGNAFEYVLLEMQSYLVMLSDNLRCTFWLYCLSLKEKTKNKKSKARVEEKFSQLHSQLKYSMQTNEFEKNSNSTYTVVEKIYKEAVFFKHLNSEDNIKSTVVVLNVCDAYGRKFQSEYVYYAAIMKSIFLKNTNNDEEFGMVAMMTEKVLRLCALTADRSSKISNKVIKDIFNSDKEFINYIKNTFVDKSNVAISGRKNGAQGTETFPVLNDVNEFSPYIKQWLLSAFVSILQFDSVFFIWDVLFYYKWENVIFESICIALIGLLKPWFQLCTSKANLEKVFLKEPSCLYLLDIRRALFHVLRKGSFLDIAAMNRNIRFKGEEVKEPRMPTPVVTLPKKSTPDFIPWVPINKDRSDSSLIYKVDLPFDLYIDSVRFMPDNSTIIKVTGKVLNMYLGQKEKSIKFQSFPILDSFWRYPKFNLKQAINLESNPMNPDTVIMMRVYTQEHHSKKICVLGSCLFGPFSNKYGKQAVLRAGGHQVRVRHGVPDPDFNVEHMLASHMDDNPLMPGLTILLRVLPHSKEFVPAPVYESGYYHSEEAQPNESEKKLYEHYKDIGNIGDTIHDKATLLFGQASMSDSTISQLIQQNLQKEGFDVEDFPYQRYVAYNKDHGFMVLVDKVSGLPLFLEGRYLQCLAQVFPGEETKIGNGNTQVVSFVTENLELDSPQRAPDWSDEPKNVKPDYDDQGFILFSLYGLRPRFNSATGKVLDKEGKNPKFNLQHAIAWAAMTCFNRGSVYAGIHHIPLLKGRPSDDIIEKLSYLPLDYICKKFKNQVKVFEAASIEVCIWDGRFSNNECPPLPTHTDLLNISPNPMKYIKASEQKTGATAIDLLKQGMMNQSDFFKHKKEIIKQLNKIFKDNLDEALIKSGFSTMI